MNKTDLDTAQIIANLRDTARLQHGDRPGSIMHLAADCISQLKTQLDEACAEVERVKQQDGDSEKKIRPQVYRYLITSLIKAGSPISMTSRKALEFADMLIATAEEAEAEVKAEAEAE